MKADAMPGVSAKWIRQKVYGIKRHIANGDNMNARSANRCISSPVRGFTIIETLISVGVIAILAGIGVALYNTWYDPRARSSEVMEQYDVLRTTIQEDYRAGGMRADCSGLRDVARNNLQSRYVKLDLVTQPMDKNAPDKGHRPVLLVTGTIQDHGPRGVRIARAVHDNLLKSGVVMQDASVTDSFVLFALRLTDGPMCQVALGASAPAVAASSSNGCPPDKEWVSHSSGPGATVAACVQRCQPGQIRDPQNWRWCTSATPSSQTGTNPAPPAPAAAVQSPCLPHQYWNELSKTCVNVCSPGRYYIPGQATCSTTPPAGVQ
jgi:prepilin-type N-terminal cleavage/methylation domain-containing protein